MKLFTIFVLVGALLVAGYAAFAAVPSDATTSLCHVTSTTLKAPATAKKGVAITMTVTEGKTPAHAVKATLQMKSGTTWKTVASGNLVAGKKSFKWTPAKAGTYKFRCRVTHLSASHLSATKTVKAL